MAKSEKKGSPVRAWIIVSSAACSLKELRLINYSSHLVERQESFS